ncbi:hypothetical protein MHYP_G00060840 [Metynnis hypsauchen]
MGPIWANIHWTSMGALLYPPVWANDGAEAPAYCKTFGWCSCLQSPFLQNALLRRLSHDQKEEGVQRNMFIFQIKEHRWLLI